MSKIPDDVRQKIIEKYNNRCAYCLVAQQYSMQRLEVDHIVPTAKDGTDDESNLCACCRTCNGHKYEKTEAIDPETDKLVPLYNPSSQSWDDHFRWSDDAAFVEGITAIGRATVVALKLNNTIFIVARRNWMRVNWHPPND